MAFDNQKYNYHAKQAFQSSFEKYQVDYES
jgi:hypothetical protein